MYFLVFMSFKFHKPKIYSLHFVEMLPPKHHFSLVNFLFSEMQSFFQFSYFWKIIVSF